VFFAVVMMGFGMGQSAAMVSFSSFFVHV